MDTVKDAKYLNDLWKQARRPGRFGNDEKRFQQILEREKSFYNRSHRLQRLLAFLLAS